MVSLSWFVAGVRLFKEELEYNRLMLNKLNIMK